MAVVSLLSALPSRANVQLHASDGRQDVYHTDMLTNDNLLAEIGHQQRHLGANVLLPYNPGQHNNAVVSERPTPQ